jgi:hypothetical protein
MVETFTPAVCGSRVRQRVGVVLFALSAIAAAAALGALLGFAGDALGARRAVLAAAVLALLAAAREAGLVRLPLPQSRRQVPEPWRVDLPLPVWATGYGAGLGVGFLTYQPVSTYWVACAGALALARPLPAALCFGLFGAGRALTLLWPRRRGVEATEAVERIVARRPALTRANVAGLAACAALLALAPAAEGARVGAGLDPSVSGTVFAWARPDGSVVVRRPGGDTRVPNAAAPSLDGRFLAYVDDQGIRVIDWTDGNREQVARVRGNVRLPALDWPLLAYRADTSTRLRLVLRNLQTGTARVITSVRPPIDLGRPSLRSGRIAWHVVSRARSRIWVLPLSTGRRRLVRQSRIALLRNPALSSNRILWTEERSGRAFVRLRPIRAGRRVRARTLTRLRTRTVGYWTTALSARTAYLTLWPLSTRAATVYERDL